MHVSLDSALGRQRRLNSVGESVLQIAPNAAAAYSLRSLTGGDPKVVRVRRDTDNAEQDFTASGVSSGALTSFTNADYAKYTSDFSSGDDSWGVFDGVTETGNIDGIGGLDDNLRLAIGTASSGHRTFRSYILPVGQKFNFSARVFIPSTNSDVNGIRVRDAAGNSIVPVTIIAQDQWVTVTANDVTVTNAQVRINLQKGTTVSFTGNGSDVIYLREITVTQVTSDGFVDTWYDQSGNGNDAEQPTDGNQPKIVSSGSLVPDNGIDFDGGEFLVASSVSGLESPFSIFSTSVRDSNGYTASFSKSIASNRYFAVFESSGTSIASPRNPNSGVTVAASVSGADRLTFALTTGKTSTSVGAKGGTVVTTTEDYGSDFSSTSGLDQLSIGVHRTVSPSGYFDGRIRELIFYTSDQTDNRSAVETNIANHYNITLV